MRIIDAKSIASILLVMLTLCLGHGIKQLALGAKGGVS